MMCERTFLHSSACVLRSPCGEARRASLLAPFGKNQGQKPLSPLRGENRFFVLKNASRINPTSVPPVGFIRFAQLPGGFPSLRWRSAREISIVCCACFAAHKSQNRLFCEFYSSLRSHKRAVLASLAQRSKPLFFVRLARASARIKTLGAKASYFFRVLCSEVLLFLECFIYIVRSCF